MTKHEIKCPNCESKFDVSNYLYALKQRLMDKIDLIIKNMKEEDLE